MTTEHTKRNELREKQINALSDAQLDAVTGGTKAVDKSSSHLFLHCCNGQHIK